MVVNRNSNGPTLLLIAKDGISICSIVTCIKMFLFGIRRIGYLQPRITFHRYTTIFPCKMTPNMLSFGEEIEVNMQIHALV